MDESNALIQRARLVLDMPLAGGVSGTTTDLMEVATTFGVSDLHLYALGVLGHLGSAGAHSFHEIAKAASFAGVPYRDGGLRVVHPAGLHAHRPGALPRVRRHHPRAGGRGRRWRRGCRVSAIDDAVAAKKLRLYWDVAALPAGAPDKGALLDALWGVLRDQHPAPGVSQDERLDVRAVAPAPGGGVQVHIYYLFDRDFAAMYDQTEAFEGEVAVGPDGTATVVDWRPAS